MRLKAEGSGAIILGEFRENWSEFREFPTLHHTACHAQKGEECPCQIKAFTTTIMHLSHLFARRVRPEIHHKQDLPTATHHNMAPNGVGISFYTPSQQAIFLPFILNCLL